MKHLVKIIIPILFIGSMLVSIPACDLYTQIDEDTLIILAAIFTSITLIVLITWLILHRRINAKLDKLLTLSLKHFPEQKTNLKHYDTCPKKLSKLIESFMQASKEIEKRETELLRSNEFTTSILNNISDAVCVLEPKEFRIVAVNPAFLKMHNIKLREAIGKDCHSVAHCKDLNGNNNLCPGKKAAEDGTLHSGRRRCKGNSEGEQIICAISASPILDHTGKVTKIIRVANNITNIIKQQRQIEHMAYHDSLTGLPNRSLFKDRLNQAILHSTRNHNSGVIALLDLDKFKQINDTYGHAAGDEILKTVAHRLTLSVRESDTVARMSGDEFLAIFHHVTDHNHAKILAQQLLSNICQPISIGNKEITIAASIGLCFFPEQGTNIDELLKCADKAMYTAKETGRNRIYLTTNDSNP